MIKHYSELTKNEVFDLLSLRCAVFVVEQNCPYQDPDEKDQDAYHLLISQQNKLVGTARILKPGVAYHEVAIGRVASHSEFRGQKIGHAILKESMAFIQNNWPNENVRISAQTYLIDFYQQYGFVETGKRYLEDGLPHTEMLFDKNAKS